MGNAITYERVVAGVVVARPGTRASQQAFSVVLNTHAPSSLFIVCCVVCSARKTVLTALRKAENTLKAALHTHTRNPTHTLTLFLPQSSIEEIFTDVYDVKSKELLRQGTFISLIHVCSAVI